MSIQCSGLINTQRFETETEADDTSSTIDFTTLFHDNIPLYATSNTLFLMWKYHSHAIFNIDGSKGNDNLSVNDDKSIVHGYEGNDYIKNDSNGSQIYGDQGNDFIYNIGNNNWLFGGSGNDIFQHFGDGNSIHMGRDNDKIIINGDNNIIHGSLGDDTFSGHGNNNRIYGGDGNDTINYSNYTSGTNLFVIGGSGNDTIITTSSNDTVYYHYRVNRDATDVVDLGTGQDTLKLIFNTTDFVSLFEQNGFETAKAFYDALFEMGNNSSNLDFSTFGFDLNAKNIDILSISANPEAQNDTIHVDKNHPAEAWDLLANDFILPNYEITGISVNYKEMELGKSVAIDDLVSLTLNHNNTLSADYLDFYKELANNEATNKKLIYTFNYRENTVESISSSVHESKPAPNPFKWGEINLKMIGVNDAPIASNDSFSLDKTSTLQGNLFQDNGFGKDFDYDKGDSIHITKINGVNIKEGQTITLDSGATLNIMAGGNFTYQGALNSIDSFSYQINDTLNENSTATAQFINDHIEPSTLSVYDTSVFEKGPGDISYLEFNVVRNGNTYNAIDVDFTTAGGTAQGIINQDFELTSGTLSFKAGETTKTVKIKIFGDNQIEKNESIFFHQG